jgi:putative ABC transport system ATP-binding protein
LYAFLSRQIGVYMDNILEFKNITYYYNSGERKISILEDASYIFKKGTLYTIAGASGSGKTTTLTIAGALEAQKSGEVLFQNQDLREIGYTAYRNRKIGIVFQSYNLLNYLTPFQNVMAAIEITKNPIENKKQHAEELLYRMGLTKEQIHRNINKLSGGEQQRVAIARAISTDADIILADEPTGNLDVDTAREIIGIFKELAHQDGKCVIAVTHSQDFASLADDVIKLENKKFSSNTIEESDTGGVL